MNVIVVYRDEINYLDSIVCSDDLGYKVFFKDNEAGETIGIWTCKDFESANEQALSLINF